MSFKIVVEGDYACFTRPEFKVERVSYDVPTPGALEGMLKSIYWKPAIRYVIDKIVVFNPIESVNIRRNEVKDKVSFQNMKNKMNGGDSNPEIITSESRSQRNALVLKNVKYGISFHFELTNIQNERSKQIGNERAKHYSIIKRRIENGQFFRVPCLGCSEFSVRRIELVDAFDHSKIDRSIRGDVDLGFMIYKVIFTDDKIRENWSESDFSDNAMSIYYHPHMINGIIDVKKYREELTC